MMIFNYFYNVNFTCMFGYVYYKLVVKYYNE